MSIVMEDVLEYALKLPAESQTDLIEALLANSEPSKEIMDAHLAEVIRRRENYRSGKTQGIPLEVVMQQARETLRKLQANEI